MTQGLGVRLIQRLLQTQTFVQSIGLAKSRETCVIVVVYISSFNLILDADVTTSSEF